MTVPRTRDLNIRRRRVPLAEIYCSISENFHIVYTNKTGESSVGVTTLPAPRSLEGWLGFERNCRSAVTPDARCGGNIHAPYSPGDSHPVTQYTAVLTDFLLDSDSCHVKYVRRTAWWKPCDTIDKGPRQGSFVSVGQQGGKKQEGHQNPHIPSVARTDRLAVILKETGGGF